ncbi:MAG: hypothetical protein KJ808_05955 [Acidobacteria bacterium]|nr:hypothetical protein [Acidobacteriota bacterium]MBU4307057.1 hypothetical protein [Acidobacteriota bacterium]MCG2810262.1 hypothetical protein [Candidatus Aminicenantes bacterium]
MPRLFGFAKKSAVAEKVAHFLVGLTLILKGIDKAEHYRQNPLTVLFLFAAGAFIILGAAFHQRIEKKVPNFTALFHVAEGIALILIGFVLLKKSSRMPYFLFFAGSVYLALGAFNLFTNEEQKKKFGPKLPLVLGTVFWIAALVAFVLNFLGSGNTWAYITAGVLAACGTFLLLFRKRLAAHSGMQFEEEKEGGHIAEG